MVYFTVQSSTTLLQKYESCFYFVTVLPLPRDGSRKPHKMKRTRRQADKMKRTRRQADKKTRRQADKKTRRQDDKRTKRQDDKRTKRQSNQTTIKPNDNQTKRNKFYYEVKLRETSSRQRNHFVGDKTAKDYNAFDQTTASEIMDQVEARLVLLQ